MSAAGAKAADNAVMRMCSIAKECEVPDVSVALCLYLVFVGLLTCLGAEPQRPLSMHNQTELTTAMVTSSHIVLPTATINYRRKLSGA